MKLLFDQNLSFKLCQQLADLFPDSSQTNLLGMARASDTELWQYARNNDFTLVTQDSDFAEMAVILRPPPKVIWLRCGNQPTATIEKLFRDHAAIIRTFEHDTAAACLEIY